MLGWFLRFIAVSLLLVSVRVAALVVSGYLRMHLHNAL